MKRKQTPPNDASADATKATASHPEGTTPAATPTGSTPKPLDAPLATPSEPAPVPAAEGGPPVPPDFSAFPTPAEHPVRKPFLTIKTGGIRRAAQGVQYWMGRRRTRRILRHMAQDKRDLINAFLSLERLYIIEDANGEMLTKESMEEMSLAELLDEYQAYLRQLEEDIPFDR